MSAWVKPSAAFLADPAVGDLVLSFAETSHRAATLGALDATMASYVGRFEIEHFVLYAATDRDKRPTVARIAGSSHPGWRKHYDANRFANRDALLSSGLHDASPTTWTKFQRERAISNEQAVIFEEARAFGLRDGFYLPIHQADGSMLGVSMMAQQALPENRETLAALHMLAIYYQLAALRLGLIAAAPAPQRREKPLLTARQCECLQWVRAGESSWEIGRILNLSEHTVSEHLEAARKRLGVRTTTQAVIEAGKLGLIKL
jgi:LuxR family quorum sensing-dependent transcriptional regulator